MHLWLVVDPWVDRGTYSLYFLKWGDLPYVCWFGSKCGSKCTKFGHLILRRIINIVATRCQIITLKCTKFDFGEGIPLDPAGSLLLRGGEEKGKERSPFYFFQICAHAQMTRQCLPDDVDEMLNSMKGRSAPALSTSSSD